MSPTIPSEMTDQIIDHLHDDNNALQNCSLVCRAWVASSRFHLFYTVSMVLTKRAEAFSRLLTYSPHLAQYVKVLYIEEGQPPFSTRFVERIIPSIAPKLTNVTTIWLSRVQFSSPAVLSAFTGNFPGVRSLALQSPVFSRFQDLTSLAIVYPHLEKLRLVTASWTTDSRDDKAPATGCFPHLHNLNLLRSPTSRIIKWMESSNYPIYGIERLSVIVTTREEIPAVSELLHSLGPCLKHLEIGMPTFTVGGSQGTLTSISQNTSLRTLNFVELVLYYQTRESTRAACKWVADTLMLITSPNIEEIMFWVRYEDAEELRLLNLERIDTILQNSIFQNLRRVTFTMKGPLDDEMDKEEIMQRMGGLTRRKLLVFE